MIRDYRLHELLHQDFEELCSRICIIVLGEGFVNFAAGRDCGKDGTFCGRAILLPSTTKPYEGKFVVQIKHTTNPTAQCSSSLFKRILDSELPKIKKLYNSKKLEHYFIMTNYKLTANASSDLEEQIKNEVPKLNSVTIWGKERINTFLKDHKEIANDFGLTQIRNPLRIRANDLINVILALKEQFSLSADYSNEDFTYTEMAKKKCAQRIKQ